MLYEENAVLKSLDDIDIRVGAIFPDVYENSILSLGFNIVYHLLNDKNDVFCERITFPNTKSIETNTPLNKFDILSYTIHHSGCYFRVVDILKKVKIPILSENRTSDDPLIIAGGPAVTANPMPIEKFIDIFCIGEGENLLNEFIDTFKKFENPRMHLEEFLEIEGVYIPKFKNNTNIALIEDMDKKFHIYKPITVKDENNKIYNDIRLDVLRGCSHGCRFCVSGYLYKPARKTSFDKLIEICEASRENSGINNVYLIGPDLSDHPQIFEIIKTLHEKNFNVDVSSMRIEKITKEFLEIIKNAGLERFDIAPESIYRIRKSLNKDVSDELIQNTIEMILGVGLNIGFLMMFGFPNETNEDILDLAKFIKSILKTRDSINKNLRVEFKLSPLIPKPHTPFQWESFDIDAINSKINILMGELIDLNLSSIGRTFAGHTYLNDNINLRIDFNSIGHCYKEYILSCGGSDLGYFIANKDYTTPIHEWEEYFPKYEIGDELPWDCINLGYKDLFLKKEYKMMFKNEITPWCGEFPCYNCKDNCLDNPFLSKH